MTDNKVLFTKEMQKDVHDPDSDDARRSTFGCCATCWSTDGGYQRRAALTTTGPSVVEQGLKYVHNDTCYPALLVIGQMIDALKSGKYDRSQNGTDHHADRRRLPCEQLYLSASQSA